MRGMSKFKVAVAAVASSGLLQISSPHAASAEQISWFGNRSEDGASLIYGTPDSGYGKIVFSCQAGQEDVTFVYEHEPINPADGVKVNVFLSAGGEDIAIPTTGSRLQIDDVFLLEGHTKLDSRLRKILNAEGELTVTVEDGIEAYPLEGAAEAAKHLLKTCSPNG